MTVLPIVLSLSVVAFAQLRDPAIPYSSWGEAARETDIAITGRTLARPANGQYAVGDAVILNDDGKRYRAHITAITDGRYTVKYDGFGPEWVTYASADDLLGYQPGYSPKASAQVARSWRVGDEVQARDVGGKWYDARIIAVRGAQFKVHFDGRPVSADAWVTSDRVRFFPGGPRVTPPLALGKYACATSSWNATNGSSAIQPRGSLVLFAGGKYQYLGFEKPSNGTFKADVATRAVTFKGGHLDGGVLTPMVQREARAYLTAPRINERWTCGKAD